MFPYVDLFGREFPTYGLAVCAGVLLAFLCYKLCWKLSRVQQADMELTFIWCVAGAFLGAKLLSVLTQLPAIFRDWNFLFTHTQAFLEQYLYAGFVFYGGLYGALAAAFLYARHTKLDRDLQLRVLVPLIALIHGMGRVGCFCMGCCYGRPTGSSLGVVFQCSPIAPNGVALVPVQLFEAAGEFLLFGALLLLSRRGAPGKALLGGYLAVYGVLRFILEFFRYDSYRGFLGPLSLSQWISLVTVALGAGLLFRVRKSPTRPEGA